MRYVLGLLDEQHISTFLYILFVGALISANRSAADSALLTASALFERSTEPDRKATS
jgi:hypothetical protein